MEPGFKTPGVILVVDDEPSVAQTLALLFQESGYTATVAYSGRQAIELVSQVAIDLALVDVTLPDLNGIKTAVEIRKRLPTCKTLLMSGDPATAVPILESAKQQGLQFQVFEKPIPLPDLLDTVASLLSQEGHFHLRESKAA